MHDAHLSQEVQEAITLSFICQESHDPTGRYQRTLSHKGLGQSPQLSWSIHPYPRVLLSHSVLLCSGGHPEDFLL